MLSIKLEIKQDYITMHVQPIIKTSITDWSSKMWRSDVAGAVRGVSKNRSTFTFRIKQWDKDSGTDWS